MAIIHALGLTHWNPAACKKLMGRLAPASADAGFAVAIFHASQSRYAALTYFSQTYSRGKRSNTTPSPSPTSATISTKPRVTPSICGMDRRNPWFRPEAASMVLFGPGVMEATRAKAVRGPKVLQKDMMRKTPFADSGSPHAVPGTRIPDSPCVLRCITKVLCTRRGFSGTIQRTVVLCFFITI
ncbi:hypothetical protein Amal_04014 [Acetobacter malorum]|uniref:Uncharacterized protein n=1 Tax=Acetobacter malorum TaxID=178901 RepID=A0A177FZ46_9PROT|nr:hypothetical protein Amal_04014 [Acetobacter malorum]